MFLGFDSALACRGGGAGRAAAPGLADGGGHERADFLARVLEIACLVTGDLAGDLKAALGVQAAAGEGVQPAARGLREAFDGVEVHAKVDLARHLVDVLAAGA